MKGDFKHVGCDFRHKKAIWWEKVSLILKLVLHIVRCSFCSVQSCLFCISIPSVLGGYRNRIISRTFSDEHRRVTGHYLDLRSFLLLSMVFSLSPRHFGQYHLPFGLYVSPTQEKWNHSMGHWSLSQPIISPYDTCSQRQ